MVEQPITVNAWFRAFGGVVQRCSHRSLVLGDLPANFSVFWPSGKGPFPALYYLSGLTCTDENAVTKMTPVYAALEEAKMVMIFPDTSPRGAGVPKEDEEWDLGTGAGFYLDATAAPWSKNYKMYTYVVNELHDLLNKAYGSLLNGKFGIMGHSMGGHGALTIGLKNPTKFLSMSAFAPITNPMKCPWGQKAFNAYLGADELKWKDYDAVELLEKNKGTKQKIKIDVGLQDPFWNQLGMETFLATAAKHRVHLEAGLQDGYDHSYFFVATFIQKHVEFHKTVLCAPPSK
eukprot:Trichotokara_eunicae@DN4547_c0_g1_i1.p1